jgi:hypothetical protein
MPCHPLIPFTEDHFKITAHKNSVMKEAISLYSALLILMSPTITSVCSWVLNSLADGTKEPLINYKLSLQGLKRIAARRVSKRMAVVPRSLSDLG